MAYVPISKSNNDNSAIRCLQFVSVTTHWAVFILSCVAASRAPGYIMPLSMKVKLVVLTTVGLASTVGAVVMTKDNSDDSKITMGFWGCWKVLTFTLSLLVLANLLTARQFGYITLMPYFLFLGCCGCAVGVGGFILCCGSEESKKELSVKWRESLASNNQSPAEQRG